MLIAKFLSHIYIVSSTFGPFRYKFPISKLNNNLQRAYSIVKYFFNFER